MCVHHMSGHVTSCLGGGPNNVSLIGYRLELLREPVDPPCLGIDTGGHGIADAQVLISYNRGVGDQRTYEQNTLHGSTKETTEWTPDAGAVVHYRGLVRVASPSRSSMSIWMCGLQTITDVS